MSNEIHSFLVKRSQYYAQIHGLIVFPWQSSALWRVCDDQNSSKEILSNTNQFDSSARRFVRHEPPDFLQYLLVLFLPSPQLEPVRWPILCLVRLSPFSLEHRSDGPFRSIPPRFRFVTQLSPVVGNFNAVEDDSSVRFSRSSPSVVRDDSKLRITADASFFNLYTSFIRVYVRRTSLKSSSVLIRSSAKFLRKFSSWLRRVRLSAKSERRQWFRERKREIIFICKYYIIETK